ncbi:hypothetical protein K0M31_014724 [Melipona bicolor]|uniref:Uncharacterized protein n=1 Tax=Melipona bicolor TaxID=60889 RepID=A0AA40KFW0_9HYME|nr:hypothetical protein K0M31_014724 [Melipona bicolor]
MTSAGPWQALDRREQLDTYVRTYVRARLIAQEKRVCFCKGPARERGKEGERDNFSAEYRHYATIRALNACNLFRAATARVSCARGRSRPRSRLERFIRVALLRIRRRGLYARNRQQLVAPRVPQRLSPRETR